MRSTLQRAALAINGRIGRLVPRGLRKRLRDLLFPRDPRPKMELLMDVASTCNLRCPSCPVGNVGNINPTGLVDKELFRKVIAKAARDYNISDVSLFNWGEPFLHPELPELIAIVRAHGLHCSVSSNLNMVRRLDDVFRADPTLFRISLSGFTQETYGQSHVRGKIEKVKANMRLVAEAKRRVGNTTTNVQVYFHKYRHNLHEVAAMKAYADELGFTWIENWAYYMPLEKVIALAEGTLDEKEAGWVDDTFALPIREAIKEAQAYKQLPCQLYSRQIVLDLEGRLNICCSVHDYKTSGGLGTFLDMTPADLLRAKENHPTCTSCMRNGAHIYGEYYSVPALSKKYDELVEQNLKRTPAKRARSLPVV